MHRHHIIPTHAGGLDDEDNIVLLSVEDHAEAHRQLFEKYGRWQDKLAWQGLAKLITKEELVRELCRQAAIDAARKRGWKIGEKKIRKEGVGSGTSKRKWFYDPKSNERKCFLEDEVIPEGWLPGQGKRKRENCFWFNDGVNEGQYNIDHAPNNWKRGRLSSAFRKEGPREAEAGPGWAKGR